MFDADLSLALTPLAGLATYCLAQIAVSWLAARQTPYFSLFLGFAIGFSAVMGMNLALLWHSSSSGPDCLGLLLMNLIAYAALAFGYFNFVNMSITSLRIRMLREMLNHDGEMSREKLLSCYSTDQMIEMRITRLIGGAHLVERLGRLHVGKRRFLLLARIFTLLRWIVFGRAFADGAGPDRPC